MLAYRPLASALHAARASSGACWALSLTTAAVLLYHPLALLTIAASVLLAAWAAGVGRAVAGTLRLALAIAVPLVIVNVLISRQGLTVFARIGDLGPFGQGDLTVEALAYGVVIASKLTIVILICALASLAIDPDELLGVLRWLSFRSALTASLTLRMAPLLAADARRLAEAQRTRPDGGGRRTLRARALLLTATVGGALDRALDVAATLEMRGFAAARRRRASPLPLSRHDLAFRASALAVLALALGARLSGAAAFDAYPLLRFPVTVATAGFCAAIGVVALLPLLDRHGIDPP